MYRKLLLPAFFYSGIIYFNRYRAFLLNYLLLKLSIK
jgi:hypothetical protein